MEIVCSPCLSEQDLEVISSATSTQAASDLAISSFKLLLKRKENAQAASLFAFLVAEKKIKILLAQQKNGELFHTKYGLFKNDFETVGLSRFSK